MWLADVMFVSKRVLIVSLLSEPCFVLCNVRILHTWLMKFLQKKTYNLALNFTLCIKIYTKSEFTFKNIQRLTIIM